MVEQIGVLHRFMILALRPDHGISAGLDSRFLHSQDIQLVEDALVGKDHGIETEDRHCEDDEGNDAFSYLPVAGIGPDQW